MRSGERGERDLYMHYVRVIKTFAREKGRGIDRYRHKELVVHMRACIGRQRTIGPRSLLYDSCQQWESLCVGTDLLVKEPAQIWG